MSNDLVSLHNEIIVANSPSDTLEELKKNKEIIISMFSRVRATKRLNKTILTQLKSPNTVIRNAVLEIVDTHPEKKALKYLFEALEDETNTNLRIKIVETIDRIENKGKTAGQKTIVRDFRDINLIRSEATS